MIAIGLVLALVIGLTLGLFGGGGSILTVPVFVYVLGFDPKLAIAMSFPVVGGTSLVGSIGHWRAGNVRLSSALMFGLVAMAGSYSGARASRLLDGRAQLAILGIAMAVAAVMMLRSASRDASDVPVQRAASGALYLVAFLVGALTGVVGIGGGFLIVPALVVFGRVPMREAVGTSLLVIAMNCVSGFAGQRQTRAIPWPFVIVFSAVAIAGILAGTRFAGVVPQRTLKKGFAVLLFVIAAARALAESSDSCNLGTGTGRMFFKRFYDDGLAQASYLIGCDASGEAVVVDANRDIEQYVAAAAEEQLRITHVTETHIHADFVSGSRELAKRTDATLLLSVEGGTDWQYAFRRGRRRDASARWRARSMPAACASTCCTRPATRPSTSCSSRRISQRPTGRSGSCRVTACSTDSSPRRGSGLDQGAFLPPVQIAMSPHEASDSEGSEGGIVAPRG